MMLLFCHDWQKLKLVVKICCLRISQVDNNKLENFKVVFDGHGYEQYLANCQKSDRSEIDGHISDSRVTFLPERKDNKLMALPVC